MLDDRLGRVSSYRLRRRNSASLKIVRVTCQFAKCGAKSTLVTVAYEKTVSPVRDNVAQPAFNIVRNWNASVRHSFDRGETKAFEAARNRQDMRSLIKRMKVTLPAMECYVVNKAKFCHKQAKEPLLTTGSNDVKVVRNLKISSSTNKTVRTFDVFQAADE